MSAAPAPEYYPGSKRLRRESAPETPTVDDVDWEELLGKPLRKIMPGGHTLDLYTLGALAKALDRSPVTVRLWIRKGYIPGFPYRLRPMVGRDGVKRPGRRLLTLEMIVACHSAFDRRGLLGKPRFEWSQHRDLTHEILADWRRLKDQIADPS